MLFIGRFSDAFDDIAIKRNNNLGEEIVCKCCNYCNIMWYKLVVLVDYLSGHSNLVDFLVLWRPNITSITAFKSAVKIN